MVGLDARDRSLRPAVIPVTSTPSMMRTPWAWAPLERDIGDVDGIGAAVIGGEEPSHHVVEVRPAARCSATSLRERARGSRCPCMRPKVALRRRSSSISSIRGDLGASPTGIEASREAGLFLEHGVEVPGVLRDLHCRARGESRRHDQPGRVPGRTGGQPVALEQDHIATAALGQVVRDAATDHTPPTMTTEHESGRD